MDIFTDASLNEKEEIAGVSAVFVCPKTRSAGRLFFESRELFVKFRQLSAAVNQAINARPCRM